MSHDTTPRLFCFACGYAHFSLHHRPRVAGRPARLFGLIPGTPSVPEHMEAWCIKCSRKHVIGIGEYRVVTPMEAPWCEYGSNPVFR